MVSKPARIASVKCTQTGKIHPHFTNYKALVPTYLSFLCICLTSFLWYRGTISKVLNAYGAKEPHLTQHWKLKLYDFVNFSKIQFQGQLMKFLSISKESLLYSSEFCIPKFVVFMWLHCNSNSSICIINNKGMLAIFSLTLSFKDF